MATFAIGDVQGCYDEFCRLLDLCRFDATTDRLWLVGDLINRGPRNLEVLRLVMSLGDRAVTVLGNHDLHLLAIALGGHSPNRSDTFGDVLAAPDLEDIICWYAAQPLLVRDDELGFAMTHAGVPHIWSLDEATARAAEVEAVIGARDARYFEKMYGNEPPLWSDDLEGMPRLRSITNYLTRMRLIRADGTLDFSHKGTLADIPPGLVPWYELRAREPLRLKLVFGHWAALEGHTGSDACIALDTGCVWGRHLTALCLETGTFISTPASGDTIF